MTNNGDKEPLSWIHEVPYLDSQGRTVIAVHTQWRDELNEAQSRWEYYGGMTVNVGFNTQDGKKANAPVSKRFLIPALSVEEAFLKFLETFGPIRDTLIKEAENQVKGQIQAQQKSQIIVPKR